MDPITQGAIGAIVATAVAPAKRVRLAAFVGWAGGMLADADIFIRSASDPLLNIEYSVDFGVDRVWICEATGEGKLDRLWIRSGVLVVWSCSKSSS